MKYHFLNSLRNKLKCEMKWLKVRVAGRKGKKKIFLTNTPEHGNLGDQAITLAEYNMFSELLPEYAVIELSSDLINSISKRKIRKLIGNAPVFVHGGGFLGTLWLNEEYAFRKVLESVPDNKIVILPQTITYSDDGAGRTEKEMDARVYRNCKHLTLFVRNPGSVIEAEELIDKDQIILVPDMVVSYFPEVTVKQHQENKCIMCMRSDKEKNLTEKQIKEIEACVRKLYPDMNIEWSDTVEKTWIKRSERRERVERKLKEFSKAKFVITDRLHGMVFAAIAGIPCVAFNNSNGKVADVYTWISELKYVRCISKMEELEEAIKQVLNCSDNTYPLEKMKKKSGDLAKMIYEIKYSA